jgi:hypothetical protein
MAENRYLASVYQQNVLFVLAIPQFGQGDQNFTIQSIRPDVYTIT